MDFLLFFAAFASKWGGEALDLLAFPPRKLAEGQDGQGLAQRQGTGKVSRRSGHGNYLRGGRDLTIYQSSPSVPLFSFLLLYSHCFPLDTLFLLRS